MFQVGKNDHYQVVTVVEVSEMQVTVDVNHPLVGQDLNFAVEISATRDTSAEELIHGHVHGHGGHHH